MTYEAWFNAVIGANPHAWQASLGASERCDDRLIQIPTGYGKTLGVAAAWLFHRVHRGDQRWPTRLVWALPMRVLVEQTHAVLADLIARAQAAGAPEVGLHLLMGGADAGDWHLHPERPAFLVGTQDMLLSRALNRGYGTARARWPTEFGLVSHDALWVLDEVQLMDVGLATALQLAAFRMAHARAGERPAATWAMSATVQRDWLTKSPDTQAWAAGLSAHGLQAADRTTPLWADTRKPILREPAASVAEIARRVADEHESLAADTPLTLVVVNTVRRARELHAALSKELGRRDAAPELALIHSRFRPHERARWRESLLARDVTPRSRIVVATQVIEAGVDLSADLLVTDLCPWPSLVQRLGRLARRGGEGRALVFGFDTAKESAPYEPEALDAAWDALAALDDASPRALEAFESDNPSIVIGLYPYEPKHLLLREELDELFDTTPDLSGADLDVSRFIRSGDERDVLVSWIDDPADNAPPGSDYQPARASLCPVPFLEAREWLFGRDGRKGRTTQFADGKRAFVHDYLDDVWRVATSADLYPGRVVVATRSSGGYRPDTGFDPKTRDVVEVVPPVAEPTRQALADAGESREDLSATCWQTIAFHGGEVAREVTALADALSADAALSRVLHIAGRWHDAGKAHPAFQGSIQGLGDPPARPARADLAKAPPAAWARRGQLYRMGSERRLGFRHELASALALFAVLSRHAPADHPSRLGALAAVLPADGPTAVEPPTALEREILALTPEAFDLLAYLVMSHHGKVRVRLHASPDDQRAFGASGVPSIRGVRDGDALPALDLATADGGRAHLPQSALTLEPAAAGLSPATGRSWTERVAALQARYGPFRLAWLEAIFRAADVRASRALAVDPALSEVTR